MNVTYVFYSSTGSLFSPRMTKPDENSASPAGRMFGQRVNNTLNSTCNSKRASGAPRQ